jgi:hypothetical protein
VKERFERYREGLIAMSQINGCFYSSNIAQQVVARLTDDGGGSGFAAATVGSPPRTGPDLAAAPADASLPNTEEHSVPDMTVRSVMVQEFGKL